jgi:ribosomal-protein-serine acetyltransferase
MHSRKITPDLELRLLQLSDAKTLFTVVDENRAYLREWLAWVDGVKKLRDAEKLIATALQDNEKTRAFTSGIWSGGQLVGVIRYNRIDWGNRMGNPGWWLVPEAQGKGIMTQCCKVVFAHAFNELQLARICVGVATENLRGQAFVKKLGFSKVSTLKKAEWLNNRTVDHFIYCLTSNVSTGNARPGLTL